MCRHEDCFCVMINHEHNRRLFHRYLYLQDNVTVTIGAFMMILTSHLIIPYMQGIPLVSSYAPTLILTNPYVFTNYIINNGIEDNKSCVENFIIPHLVFTVLRQCRKTYIGKNCNSQKPHETMNQGYDII